MHRALEKLRYGFHPVSQLFVGALAPFLLRSLFLHGSEDEFFFLMSICLIAVVSVYSRSQSFAPKQKILQSCVARCFDFLKKKTFRARKSEA